MKLQKHKIKQFKAKYLTSFEVGEKLKLNLGFWPKVKTICFITLQSSFYTDIKKKVFLNEWDKLKLSDELSKGFPHSQSQKIALTCLEW